MDNRSIYKLIIRCLITPMSTESLNRTSHVIEDPNVVVTPRVNVDVLKQKTIMISKPKKICINTINRRLHLAKRKDKFRSIMKQL